ncbi:hypothetical protein ES703_89314 [subsurface metagenome]
MSLPKVNDLIPPWTTGLMPLCATVFFVAMSFLIYHTALKLWWTFDDPYILELAIFENPIDLFLNPDVYQRLSIANFTPLPIASYALNYHLFGFEPQWFYAYQILLLGLLATGIFLLVRRWHSLLAVWAALLFLASGPATLSGHVLMTRHYVEGACWSLLSVLLLLSASKSKVKSRCWLAGIAYLASCLCKEVYIPLVLVVPFLIEGSWRKKWQVSLPFLCALIAYIPWRFWMLGNFGGYGQTWWNNWQDWHFIMKGWLEICMSFWSWQKNDALAYLMAGGYIAGLIVVLIMLFRTRKINAVMVICMLGVGALVPVIPIITNIASADLLSYRFSFHIAFLMAISFGYLFSSTLRKVRFRSWGILCWVVTATGMLAMLGFALDNQRRLVNATLAPLVTQYGQEYLFFYHEDRWKTLAVESKGQHWVSLAHIRQALRHDISPAVCTSPFDLRDTTDTSNTRYFCYRVDSGQFEDCTELFVRDLEKFRGSLTKDLPLYVQINIMKGEYRIELGPSEPQGRYHLLLGSTANLYADFPTQPKISGRLFRSQHQFYVRIAKELLDGQWILSPEWRISFNKEQAIEWSNSLQPCPDNTTY